MTRVVWKFDLPLGDDVQVAMPAGAEVLRVATQFNNARLWAICDPEAKIQARRFLIRGTGHEIKHRALRYVGTFELNGGSLIFHVFEPYNLEEHKALV